MVDLARQNWRDYEVDGVAASGKYKPKKSKLRQWGTWVESVITAFTSNGGLIFSTRAALYADLAHAANTSGWVFGDATVAYNGIYQKSGISGAGAWARVADLPYSFITCTDDGAGTANEIIMTSDVPAYQGAMYVANIFETNTGAVTIAINGGAVRPLVTNSGGALGNGYLTAGMRIAFIDDGTSYRLLNDVASATIVDPLDLTVDAPATPAADTVRLFRREIAGRNFPAFVDENGLAAAMQPFLGRGKVRRWNPSGGIASAPGQADGFHSITVTNFTTTARTIAVTNKFTMTPRVGFVTSASAGQVGNFRASHGAAHLLGGGSGLGGFMFTMQFGISDPALVSDARMFLGMSGPAGAPSNVEPSTFLNCFGIGHGAADTNLKLFWGGSAAQSPVDLGSNFPVNTSSVDLYELALFSPPNQSVVHYEVTRLNTGHVATGTLTGTVGTQLPSLTTLLTAPWGYRTNNASALVVGLDVSQVYLATE